MREKRKLSTTLLLILICFISVGYAYITSNTNIGGTARIRANTWDIHFENLKVTEGSIEAKQAPTLNNTTSTEFYVVLNTKGDFYDFTLDIVNNGTIDAMIDNVVTKTLDTSEQNYLIYTLTYSDGTPINKKDLLSAGSTEKIRVHIGLKDNIEESDLPKKKKYLSIPIDISYIQDDNGTKVNHSKMYIEDSNSNEKADIGELITIGAEKFYVISNDGTNVKAISEYNLLVGNQYDGENTITITNPTGLQDSTAKGKTGEYPYIACVSFNEVNNYLKAYKTNLINLGGNIEDISSITKTEIDTLSTIPNTNWLRQTSYWTETQIDSNKAYAITNRNLSEYNLTNNIENGIRPVITVSVNNLNYKE